MPLAGLAGRAWEEQDGARQRYPQIDPLLLSSVMSSAAETAGVRSALIVATSHYEDPSLQGLRGAAADAEALAEVLRDPDIGGFDIQTVVDQPAHVVNEAVEEYFADRGPDDLLVLHFSGHGIKNQDGELHFAATNTRLARLASTSTAANFVNRQMTASRSRRIVLLLDCCYAGAFDRGMATRGGTSIDIQERFDGRGRAVITASGALEYAFEGDQLTQDLPAQPSVFTTAMVRGLATGEADRDQDGWVGLDELYDYVYDAVREVAPQQTPGKWTFGVQGNLHLARRSRPVTEPSPLPPELQQSVESPLAGVRAAAVHELAALAEGSHAGLALGARAALARLAEDDSRSVSTAATQALGEAPVPVAATSDAPEVLPEAPPGVSAPATSAAFRLPRPRPLIIAVAAVALVLAGAAVWWLQRPPRESPGIPSSFVLEGPGNWVGDPFIIDNAVTVNLHLQDAGLTSGVLASDDPNGGCLNGRVTDIHGTDSRIEMSFVPNSPEYCDTAAITAELRDTDPKTLLVTFDSEDEGPDFQKVFAWDNG
ncbi:hypothetical protein NOCA2220170 [metagenome]|uniref:Peptidase C14 caspase domain-containing protein n=1 Tax=metagenome TaxID=256318 RepID=A0A2P2BYZ7_9ZZZZ